MTMPKFFFYHNMCSSAKFGMPICLKYFISTKFSYEIIKNIESLVDLKMLDPLRVIYSVSTSKEIQYAENLQRFYLLLVSDSIMLLIIENKS